MTKPRGQVSEGCRTIHWRTEQDPRQVSEVWDSDSFPGFEYVCSIHGVTFPGIYKSCEAALFALDNCSDYEICAIREPLGLTVPLTISHMRNYLDTARPKTPETEDKT